MALPSGLHFIGERWALAGADMNFGTSLNGQAQVISGPTPLWTATLTYGIRTDEPGQWLAWEAWVAERRGRLVAEEIQPHERRLSGASGWGTTGITLVLEGGGGGGGSDFNADFNADFGGSSGDTTGITFDGVTLFLEPALAAPAAQYATVIEVNDPASFTVGKFFWVQDNMHMTTSIMGNLVYFQPPLRAPVNAGDHISGSSTIRMIFASADQGILDHEGGAVYARVPVTFVEEI